MGTPGVKWTKKCSPPNLSFLMFLKFYGERQALELVIHKFKTDESLFITSYQLSNIFQLI